MLYTPVFMSATIFVSLSIFMFCPFYCGNFFGQKLRKVYWIWQVATVRLINHNVGALKYSKSTIFVSYKNGCQWLLAMQSINTDKASLRAAVPRYIHF